MVLGRAGQPAYIPAWVLFVVGAHVVPLARLFDRRDLLLSGLVLMAVSAVAAAAGVAAPAMPSAVAGGGALRPFTPCRFGVGSPRR